MIKETVTEVTKVTITKNGQKYTYLTTEVITKILAGGQVTPARTIK